MSDLSATLYALLWLMEAAAVAYVAYRTGLGMLSIRKPRRLPEGKGDTRFLILIPAHNEGVVVGPTIDGIRAFDYPQEKVQIFVVADDCIDYTESIAKEHGATALVKPGPATGKGDVIQWALARPEIRNGDWDAMVIFDADSRPYADFLRRMEASLAAGAQVVQGRRESGEQHGWIPRGYAVNTTQRNRTWHQAREAAGFSGALTGAGICMIRAVLAEVPPTTTTLTEDLEYTAKLTQAGVRVHYQHDAVIRIEQPPTLAPSVRQRVRWARGQLRTFFAYGPGLLWRSLRDLDFSALDTALYIAMPSLVPLQAFLLLQVAGDLVFGFWPRGSLGDSAGLPVWLLLVPLLGSMVLPYVALLQEKRKANLNDWVAFFMLMLSWMPVAFYAALTNWVQTWHRTPHGTGETPEVVQQPASRPLALKEEKTPD
jgi:cellulose synthase/poly-beta-1,6-N-acetylglucosamine synthase-like glycosyltransferase